MKQFIINLGIVYLGGFMFYCAVMLWFNRPNLRRQLAWVTECNDLNVSYSNTLNATIRELTDINQRCYLDAVEKDNVISMYDEAAGDARREIERITNRNAWQAKTIQQNLETIGHHELTIKEYHKLLKDTQVAVLEAQTEVRNATEALEFMKSELVMAERQLERLS